MLRIDLLPGHFAAARAAKLCIVAVAAALIIALVGCTAMLMSAKAREKKLTADLADAKQRADAVRALEAELSQVQADMAPIGGKVAFVETAATCGEQYWAAWDDVNKYVFARARVLDVSIQGSSVSFNAELPDTTSVGRFILNIIRCPHISNIQIGGTIPAGPGVGPAGSGGGGGGGTGMMGGMMGGMAPGMGGGEMGGMMGAPGMGGMMGGMMGGGSNGGGGGGAARLGGPIALSVNATLGTAMETPAPGGSGGAGAAAGGPPGGAMMGGSGGSGAPMMGAPGTMSGPPSGGSGGA